MQTTPGEGFYNCEEIPFFEIGSVFYDEYLVNIRLPITSHSNKNRNIGPVSELHFVVIKSSQYYWYSKSIQHFLFQELISIKQCTLDNAGCESERINESNVADYIVDTDLHS